LYWGDNGGHRAELTMCRILIADPSEVIRLGVRCIAEARPGREIVAEAGNGDQAILQATSCKPDVVVIEHLLPGIDGIEVTAYVRKRLPETEVLIFTALETDVLLSRALAAGARGFVLKSEPDRCLDEAIDWLAAHKPFFSNRISEILLRSCLAAGRRSNDVLTNREQSVIRLIAHGHTNKGVGAILGITIKTVETHRAAIMRKLDLSSSAALVRYAIRNKLVEA
jgi:DNA-binding NarL/FixJ family response regulator